MFRFSEAEQLLDQALQQRRFGYYAIDIENDLIDLVDEVVRLAGHIDVIVNCAGITLTPADSNQPIPNIQKLLAQTSWQLTT